MKLISRKWFVD